MKSLITLGLVVLVLACAGPLAAPTPTPNQYAILKAYLEEARALIDGDKEASDALYHEIEPGEKDVATIEGRTAWQEFGMRYYPLLLEFQSEWEALDPPPIAQAYHAQMALVIEKQLERYMAVQIAPVAVEDAFMEIVFGNLDELELELLLEAEAERKFQTLWRIATEGEK